MRRTFFSFHYQPDVWRAWNVRNSWVVQNDKESRGFFDSSVFESKRRDSDDVLKRFLREGLANTSVTCVLSGAETWSRRWVRYEIAQSILKGNGLLTVDIDGVKNKDQQTTKKGADPLANMGLYKWNDRTFLAEWDGFKWIGYQDYTQSVPNSILWFPPPISTSVVQLSTYCMRYDYAAQRGAVNLPGWIEVAAGLAKR